MEQSDHDLLIRIAEKVDIMSSRQNEFMSMYETRHQALMNRVNILEAKDRGDSEKTKAISVDVQRSLANHERIGGLESRMQGIEDDVKDLKKKSDLFDAINAIGVMISGVIGYIFGNK